MKTSLQITIPENLDNNEDSKRDIHGFNLHSNRKTQDLQSKLRAWGLCERVEGEGRGTEGSREKYTAQ